MEITLEKVDKVKERTGVSYAEAKHALEMNDGDVLEAIIYLEELKYTDSKSEFTNRVDDRYETMDEFKKWLKDLINKGNITRIKISKGEKEIVDVPVNAGIAAGVIAVILPPVLAFGVIAAVVSQLTIEITKADGSIEVVNKYITKAVDEIKDVASDIGSKVKDKVSEVKSECKKSNKTTYKASNADEVVYSYTVKFDDEQE